jgi:four helix bundle protein
MTNPNDTRAAALPHHKLVAYEVSLEFLTAVRAAAIRDADLRDQAMRAAKSACLNIAEGAGRKSRADKARVYAIARGEAVEAIAAVEIAAAAGDAADEAGRNAVRVAGRLVALLTGLAR